MQLHTIRYPNFKVESNWMLTTSQPEKYYPIESDGLTNWALRSLIICSHDRTILVDTGFGNKQDNTYLASYHLNGDYQLEEQLLSIGLTALDFTDIILTHLHPDHCGGCLKKENEHILPTFPNARLWIGKDQWESAIHPDPREKDSFLSENILPLKDFYPIEWVGKPGSYIPDIYFHLVSGHTCGQLIPEIHTGKLSVLFGADLFPSAAHIDLNINTLYDMDPSKACCEKSDMLEYCLERRILVFFQHGISVECVSLKKQKNIIYPSRIFKLSDLKSFL